MLTGSKPSECDLLRPTTISQISVNLLLGNSVQVESGPHIVSEFWSRFWSRFEHGFGPDHKYVVISVRRTQLPVTHRSAKSFLRSIALGHS